VCSSDLTTVVAAAGCTAEQQARRDIDACYERQLQRGYRASPDVPPHPGSCEPASGGAEARRNNLPLTIPSEEIPQCK
jgi:hypothetical protein